jgi:hypothetical protein
MVRDARFRATRFGVLLTMRLRERERRHSHHVITGLVPVILAR